MLTDPLWGSTGDISLPSSQQLARGFSCGPADPALFNWLFQQVYGEMGDVIVNLGGLSPDAADMTQLRQSIMAHVVDAMSAPIATLDYPTIATADNRLSIGATASTAGGVVSLAGGETITLAKALSATHGVMRTWTMPAFTSDDLVPASTYYLRATVVAGSVVVYMQRGTDGDTIPATLVGTPGADADGGFDTTRLDMLIARVVTGTAGVVPTVTALANASRLYASFGRTEARYTTTTFSSGGATTTLNWARMWRGAFQDTYVAPTSYFESLIKQSLWGSRYTASGVAYGYWFASGTSSSNGEVDGRFTAILEA
jgi:hypothetical protein